MLKLNRVSKRFDGVPVVHQVDLSVGSGEIMVLLGPSGCGKSTLLRIMNGLVAADSGQVLVNNESLAPANIRALRRRMGYVIQDGGLFPHLSAVQNVSLMAHLLHWSKKRIAERLAELVNLTRFPAEALSRYPSQLSGGQRQRVALMRALMLDPEILLLDEPLGALDPLVRFDLQNDLKPIFRSVAKTVVLVTHDLAEAGFFADHVALMREGRIEQCGSPKDLITHPATPFVQGFITAQRGLHGEWDRA
jgi:osmoprotectant transport system ATP-binding protein